MRTIISIIVIVVAVLLHQNHKEIKGNYDTNIKNVGEKVLIRKDTLQIVDYSFFLNQYTLEDGTKINVEFTKNSLVEPK